ncbi:MAG: TIGR03089 family protein [Actinomycetota bacterium]|nr:TIGR03089 family protein [Actinomycetota bacterium]
MTPEKLFANLLAREPGRPFVTYYDEQTGERSELSAKSLANWVAKTHFLLTDELGLGVGNTALIALPAHWISVPALLGCLTAGLALTQGGDGAPLADVAFVTADTVLAAEGVENVYATATASAAVGYPDGVPAGALDYVAAVRPQADTWSAVRLVASDDDPCLYGRARGEVVRAASERARELGLAAGARLLSTRPWLGADSWLDTLLVPLAVGGSIVFVANCTDPTVLERRALQERVTNRI